MLAVTLGLCFSYSALADTTTLTVSSASKGSSNIPVALDFPVTRAGDKSYAAVLNYHTVDGTAVAGIDYIATSSSVVIPAGSNAATIPVTIAANTSANAPKTFQLMLDVATGIGPAPDFAAQQTFATGAIPQSVIAADLNGDGWVDLIVANSSDNTVSVLLNTTASGSATPSFAPQQNFATGTSPYSVVAIDVNGDGKPDLIVANSGTDTVSVLLNTTAPGATTTNFAAAQTFVTGLSPVSIAAADVNGDGKADLIVANSNGSTVSVLLNTTAPGATTPSFAAQQTVATALTPTSVAATDVNGDGKPDLIIGNGNDNTVWVLLNTTASGASVSSFSPQQTFATGMAPYSVTTAEINGDGKSDLIVTNHAASTISVLRNTTIPGATTASFAAQQIFATGSNPTSVTVADLNGDGKSDLLVANSSDSSVSVLRNTTAPGATALNFDTQQSFTTGAGPQSVTVAEINRDGKPDLIVANGSDNTVSVLLNTTAPPNAIFNFAVQQTFATGSSPEFVTAADMNGDGKPDLIVANASGNTVSVLLNTTAPGPAMPSFAAQQVFATGASPQSVIATDVNGDGKPDLIVANYFGNTVSVLLNITAPGAATPNFATQQPFATGANPASVAAADVNGDGKPDLILANRNGHSVSVLLNTTAPGAAMPSFAAQQTFTTGAGPFSVTAADVNGDGKPDLIAANQTDNTVSVLLNTTLPGATAPSFAAQQTFATGAGPFSVATADINGDGKPDLIVANLNGAAVSVLINTTAPGAITPTFAMQQSFVTGTLPPSVTVADVDGDGKPDLIVASLSSNSISVLLNTTAPGALTPSFATQRTFATGSGPQAVAAADVNGDGKPDLIVANANVNNVSLLLNTQYQATITNSAATGTIVHDYVFADGFE